MSGVKFVVLTYNTFLRPHIVQQDAQITRAKLIPAALQPFDADVLCLQECWSKFATSHLLSQFQKRGYRYIVKTKKKKSFKVIHAGLVVCSKYPVLETQFVSFDMCTGTDCFANKGFLYVRILHPQLGQVHVFNMHLQFVTATRIMSNDAPKLRVQQKQLETWAGFVAARHFPAEELVVLAGDWNLDAVNNEEYFRDMLRYLRVTLPTLTGEQQVSVDPVQNSLVGRGNEARKYGCVNVLYTGENCSCCPSRWVDFIVFSQHHRQPVASECTILPVQVSPFRTQWMPGCTQLSDHYPVMSTFLF